MRAWWGRLIPVLMGLAACAGCPTQRDNPEKSQPAAGAKQAMVETRDKVLGAARTALDDLERRANELLQGAGAKADELKSQLGPKVQAAREELRKAGAAASGAWESARQALDKAVSDLDRAVRGQEPTLKGAKP